MTQNVKRMIILVIIVLGAYGGYLIGSSQLNAENIKNKYKTELKESLVRELNSAHASIEQIYLPEFIRIELKKQKLDGEMLYEYTWLELLQKIKKENIEELERLSKTSFIHYFASLGQVDAVQRLVLTGVSIEKQNADKQTPLMVAFEHADLKTVEKIIELNANLYALIEVGAGMSKDMLNFALRNKDKKNQEKLVNFLIKNKFSFADKKNYFYDANMAGNEKYLNIILHNMSLDKAYNYGGFSMSIIDWILSVNHDEIFVQNLINSHKFNYKEAKHALSFIARSNNYSSALLQKFIKNGAPINAIEPQSKASALMLAAKAGNLEKVQILLKNKANKTLKDKNAQTAADYAKKSDNLSKAGLKQMLGLLK